MAIFGRQKEQEPAQPAPTEPTPTDPTQPTEPVADPQQPTATPDYDERFARLEETVGRMADGVNRFVENQSRPAPQAPAPLPPIEDVTDEDFAAALEEGGERARKAVKIRREADMQRMERRLSEAVAPLQTQGVGAINDLTARVALQNKELYASDPQIRDQVDARLRELPAEMLLQPQAIEYVYNAVVGENSARLMEQAKEAAMRQAREPADPVEPSRVSGRNVNAQQEGALPQPEDLTPDAPALLATRNRGLGQTPDDFARSMPPRMVRDPKTGRVKREHYESWDDRAQKHEDAKAEYDEQVESYFGR